MKKAKEPFSEFLPKFAATVAPLQLPEQLKILHLTRTITPRLRSENEWLETHILLGLCPIVTTVRFRLAPT